MADILYAPDREHVVTTNAWAFLHWLRTTRGIDLPDWAALQRWSASDQTAFGQTIAAFGRLPEAPLRLARHGGPQEALVLRRADGSRLAFSRDLLRQSQLGSVPPAEIGTGTHDVAAGGRGRAARPALAPCPADPPSGRVAAARRPATGRPAAGRRRGVALARRVAGRHHRHPRGRLARPHCWPPPPRSAPPFWSPRRRPSPRRRSSAPAAARTSPTCARSSPPAARSRRRAAAASTPGSSPT